MSENPFQPVPVTRVPKPWGYELIWARTERYVGKIIHVNRGESLSLQYHERKDETLLLLDGSVRLTLEINGDRRVIDMRRGEAFHIPPFMIHRIEANEDSNVVEVSTIDLDDVIRLEDRYGREGTTSP